MERDDLIMAEKKVAVVMGSDSDLGVVRAAIDTLKSFGIGVQARVISAHRTPQEAAAFASGARENGFSVIIAAAGKAAHLAGVLAALLATVQMPGGIPVATVAIDGAQNAAILAAQIIGITDAEIAYKLSVRREEMRRKVAEKDEKLREQLC